jgi:glycine betaine/proline transport system ATP-binding protein
MIMQRREQLSGAGAVVWLDAARRYQLSLNAIDEVLGLTLDGVEQALRHVGEDVDCGLTAPGLVVAPASMSLKSIIQLRHLSGHPILVAEDGKLLGVCGEGEIIRALAGRSRLGESFSSPS